MYRRIREPYFNVWKSRLCSEIIEDIHTYGEVVSKDIDKNTERINKN